MNLIQGSIMGRKEKMPEYPSISKGEDTPVVQEIAECGYKIAQLSDVGYLYLYQYTGKNTWDVVHHSKIVNFKHKSLDELVEYQDELRAAFLDFDEESFAFAFDELSLPTRDGTLMLFSERDSDSPKN
jgi:hypothetical protein